MKTFKEIIEQIKKNNYQGAVVRDTKTGKVLIVGEVNFYGGICCGCCEYENNIFELISYIKIENDDFYIDSELNSRIKLNLK